MTTHYLKAESRSHLINSLIAAGVAESVSNNGTPELVATAGYSIDIIGQVYSPTGEFTDVEFEGTSERLPVMEPTAGYHANLLGELTQEQLQILPIIDRPRTPVREFWT